MKPTNPTGKLVRKTGTVAFIVLFSLLVLASSAWAAPSVATEPASSLHRTSAVLHGTVDPTGDPGITDCHFDWGTDTSYSGGTVPCDQGNSIKAPTDVSATLGFLTDGLTYHFRLTVTTTSSGVLQGVDQSFVTPGFSVVHPKLGSFGPDGTEASFYESEPFSTIAMNPTQRKLFAFNPSPFQSNSSAQIYGFDVSNPLDFPLVSHFNPLPTAPANHPFADLAVDSTTGSTAGNVYYSLWPTSETEQLTVSATGGTFQLCFKGACTEDLPFNAPVSGITPPYLYNAFRELATIGGAGGYIDISGGPGDAGGANPYVFRFGASLENTSQPQITCDGSNLSGGSGCSVITTREGHGLQYFGVDSSGNSLGGAFPLEEPADSESANDLGSMAVDGAGHLWIPNRRTGQAFEYSAAGALLGSIDTSTQIKISPPGNVNYMGVAAVAFDSEDNLYASGSVSRDGFGVVSTDGTWRYSAASGYTEATKVAPSAGRISIDDSNGHYFVGDHEYDPAGNLLSILPSTVVVDPANHYLYTAELKGQVGVFGPGVPVELATVTPEPVTSLLGTSATLNAKVDPETNQVTDCHFLWVDETTYQADIASKGAGRGFDHAQVAPCAQDSGSGSGDVDVSAALSGLEAGTAYRFQIVAENANGPAKGPDQTLITLGPRLSTPTASLIDDSSATLGGQVNPVGKDTTYHFEYGDQGPCDSNPCISVPAGGAPAGSGSTSIPVSEPLSGLKPATTYHFRLVATNADATSHTRDVTFTTYATAQKFNSCSNDTLRSGFGTALPDCRAYEQASPIDKNGTDVIGNHDLIQASLSGDAITFVTHFGLPGAVGAQRFPSFLARRGAQNWSTQGLNPPAAMGDRVVLQGNTPDLSETFTGVAAFSDPQHKGPAFVMRNSATGAYTVIHSYTDISGVGPGSGGTSSLLAGSSADGSKIYFENPYIKLTSRAIAEKDNLYVWDRDTGKLSLVGILPNGTTPPGGSFAGPYDWWLNSDLIVPQVDEGGIANFYFTQNEHAISDSGDEAFFTAGETGQIYLRRDATGRTPSTVQVSASKASTADPNGVKPAIFMAATPSASKAFFASCQKLTDDSTAHSTAANTCTTSSQGQDLYLYDTTSGGLTDLTVDSNPTDFCPGTEIACGAQVQGVVGTSDAGDYVYFVANGDLDGSGPATRGDCDHTHSASTFHGDCNLYLWHAGSIEFIARLDGLQDAFNWTPGRYPTEREPTGRVSANGQSILFRTQERLTSYDNEGIPALYLYRVGDPGPICVSCTPTGAPGSSAALQSLSSGTIGINSNVPVITRNLSSDGKRVFFESAQKLVARDVNDILDVYEWEAAGAGSCSLTSSAYSSQNRGCIYLISSGTSASPSYFGDASASGDDVFIFTRDQLVPQDGDQLVDVYDASVDGGLPAQHALAPPPCDVNAGACEQAGSARGAQTGAGSAAFEGPPNPKAKPPAKGCPKGRHKVRSHGKVRCLKHPTRKHNRKAGHNRRTSR